MWIRKRRSQLLLVLSLVDILNIDNLYVADPFPSLDMAGSPPKVPPNAMLLMDVELLEVRP